MKILITKIFLLLISILISSCGSTSTNPIESCEVNTTSKPVNFILVEINAKGLPINALVPTSNIKKLDLNDPNLGLISIVDPKICPIVKKGKFKSEHNIKRESQICFVSVEKSVNNISKYQFSHNKIAVLWRPDKISKPQKNIVELAVPKNSPDGIAYKFTIATKKSDPENLNPKSCSTYLDPRIVIRK